MLLLMHMPLLQLLLLILALLLLLLLILPHALPPYSCSCSGAALP